MFVIFSCRPLTINFAVSIHLSMCRSLIFYNSLTCRIKKPVNFGA